MSEIREDRMLDRFTNKAKEGDEVSIEADIRRREREERRIRFLVNGRRETDSDCWSA